MNPVPPAHPEPVQPVIIKPVVIQKPVERIVEREREYTYVEGYRGTQEAPERHTGPILIPVNLGPTKPQIVVIPPAQQGLPGRSIDDRRTQPPRVPSRDQKVRANPEPEAKHDPIASDPVRTTPVDEVPMVARPEVPTTKPVAEVSSTQKQKPEGAGNPEQKPSDPEVKSTDQKKEPEVKATGQKQKRKYSGKGRKHTELEIEEILDWYLLTGVLPRDVSQKQRWLYKHHRRLPERRKLLEQEGVKLVVPEIEADVSNVIPMGRTNVQGSRRTSTGL